MAVQVFKNGQEKYIEPKWLQNHIEAGWSLEPQSEVESPAPEAAEAQESAPKRRGRPAKVKHEYEG